MYANDVGIRSVNKISVMLRYYVTRKKPYRYLWTKCRGILTGYIYIFFEKET